MSRESVCCGGLLKDRFAPLPATRWSLLSGINMRPSLFPSLAADQVVFGKTKAKDVMIDELSPDDSGAKIVVVEYDP